MPCRDDFAEDYQRRVMVGQSKPPLNYVSVHSYNQLAQRLDDATRAACTAMTALEYWESSQSDDVLSEAQQYCWITTSDQSHALKWFQDHKEADNRRKAELIESAKTKLTAEEKAALGIK